MTEKQMHRSTHWQNGPPLMYSPPPLGMKKGRQAKEKNTMQLAKTARGAPFPDVECSHVWGTRAVTLPRVCLIQ